MLKKNLLLCLMLGGTALAQGQSRVVNSGIPGQTSAEVLARLDTALTTTHPACVVVYVGMNDAVNDAKFLDPQATAANVATMVRKIRGAGAEPILVLVHHVDEARLLARHKAEQYGKAGPNGRVDATDAAITQVALQERVPVVDFRAVLAHAGGATAALSTDGVHLTQKGYGLLAQAVHSALLGRLDRHATVLCVGDSLTYGIGVRPFHTPEFDPQGHAYPTYPAQLQTLMNSNSH